MLGIVTDKVSIGHFYLGAVLGGCRLEGVLFCRISNNTREELECRSLNVFTRRLGFILSIEAVERERDTKYYSSHAVLWSLEYLGQIGLVTSRGK